MTSKYAQRMMRLSGKIFNEYRRPPMPQEILMENHYKDKPRKDWTEFHERNERIIKQNREAPRDVLEWFTENYYPPHPQIFILTNTLRQYGLYRDEHLDFRDEMNRINLLKGKRIGLRYVKTKTEEQLK